MPRPPASRLVVGVLCAVLGLLVPLSSGVAPARATQSLNRSTQRGRAAQTPLTVSIDTLSPSVIPRTGRVSVTGQITNDSDRTWTNLKVYLLTSPSPFRSREALQQAAATDPALEIGNRLIGRGLYQPVGDLAPGSSANYTLSVPRKDLNISGEAGVYWLGVHVLGASQDGRDRIADGRARTFVPLMHSTRGNPGPHTDLSLVLPFRRRVHRASDGTLTRPGTWRSAVSADGRLDRLLDLSGTSSGTPLTWLVDPAVLDAVRTLATDNAPRTIAPSPRGAGTGPSGRPSAAGSSSAAGASPPATGAPSGEGGEPAQRSAGAQTAARWLQTFRRQSDQHTVLALPYGDTDVAAASWSGPSGSGRLDDEAARLSASTLSGLGVDARPVLAPHSGYLSSSSLARVDPHTTVLLSDRAAPLATSPVIHTDQGNRVVLTDSHAGSGGPAPEPRYSALAMRQRILSAAALHALSPGGDQPMVVSLPDHWDPGPDWRAQSFFTGLDVPWLDTVDLPSAIAAADTLTAHETPYVHRLRYPPRQRRAELPPANLRASRELARKGGVLAGLLSRNDTVDRSLTKEALLASSVWSRRRPQVAVNRVHSAVHAVDGLLDRVRIEGPSFVTMSSDSGTFAVTLVNGLDQPVKVGIRADTGSRDLSVAEPDPVSLGPGQRASVRLHASARNIGVHSVSLQPTTADGRPLGLGTRFNIRSSQVGLIIWVIIGVGAVVLVVASAVRVVRRVRGRGRAREATPTGAGG